MTYARVGIWKFKSGNDRTDLTTFVRDHLIPSYQQQPGFLSYLGLTSGDEYAVGVQSWETQDQAAKAGAQSGNEVRQKVGDRADLESWFHGPVIISIPKQPVDKARYARIGVWDIAPGIDHRELAEKAREALIPMFQNTTGLVSYQAIDSVEGRLVVVHTWESEAQSEQGMQSTGQWLEETLANQLALVARYDGQVVLTAPGNAASG